MKTLTMLPLLAVSVVLGGCPGFDTKPVQSGAKKVPLVISSKIVKADEPLCPGLRYVMYTEGSPKLEIVKAVPHDFNPEHTTITSVVTECREGSVMVQEEDDIE